MNLESELRRLFEIAKKADEFEFISVLINYNGMGDVRVLTHVYESKNFINEMQHFYMESTTLHTKTRFGLMLYCHIFEMDEFYNILGNLLRICSGAGFRFIPDLYNSSSSVILTPTDKFGKLFELAEQSHFEELIEGIKNLYSNKLRNAFFHSAYSLVEDDFCIVRGEGIKIGNVIHNVLNIQSQILSRIDSSLVLIAEFFNLIDYHKQQYKESKVIMGRFPDPEPILIYGDPEKGLSGFGSVSGGGRITIGNATGNYYFQSAQNIRFVRPNEAISALRKRLMEYDEGKHPGDREFNILKEEILKSKDKDTMRDLALILYNWANDTAKAASEKEGKEKDFLYKTAIKRYDMTIQINPEFNKSYHNKATTLIKMNQDGSNDAKFREEVTRLFETSIKLDKTMFEAHLNYGRFLYEEAVLEKNPEKKIEIYKKSLEHRTEAISLYPHDPEAYHCRSYNYWILADLTQDKEALLKSAISDLEKCIELRTENIDYHLDLATIIGEYGTAISDEKTIEKSIKILEDALTNFGHNSTIYYRIGNKYMSLGFTNGKVEFFERAISFFELGLKIDPENLKLINNSSVALLHVALHSENKVEQIDYLKKAIGFANQVLELDANYRSAHYNKGIALSELSRRGEKALKVQIMEDAIASLVHAEALEPGSAMYDLARIFALKEDGEKSAIWLGKYAEIEPVNADNIMGEKDFNMVLEVPVFKELLAKLKKLGQ